MTSISIIPSGPKCETSLINVFKFQFRILETGVEKEQFIELCRSVDLRSKAVTKDLYCKYSDRNKPYYKYGPMKIEIVSLEPHIAVMHVSKYFII